MNDGTLVRIGTIERNQAVDRLRGYLQGGYLTADEYEERVGLAWAATTSPEINVLFRDMPQPVNRLPVKSKSTWTIGKGIAVAVLATAGLVEFFFRLLFITVLVVSFVGLIALFVFSDENIDLTKPILWNKIPKQ
jgi:Domain of unknown function (DUF1707)